MHTRGRRASGDEGQALLFALIFILVTGVVVIAILGQAGASLKTSTVVSDRAQSSYATDAAIELARKQLAIDPTTCTSTTATPLPTQSIAGRTVSVSCYTDPSSGSALGASGWAAIVRGNLTQQAGGTANFSGPVYVAGSISGSLNEEDGSVYQFSSTACPGSLTWPSGLTVNGATSAPGNPPYRWQCTNVSTPDPPHVLPPVPTTLNPPPIYNSGGCKVFNPGKYTSISLASDNYFVSGVYYFENVSLNLGTHATIVGGTNPADISDVPGLTKCNPAGDATPGALPTGAGVEWIFGGSSTMSTANADNIELFSRVPAAAEGATTTPRISFVAVPTTGAGYLAATAGSTVLDTSGGHPGFAVHGLIYAPNNDINLDGPVGRTTAHNGIVVHDFHVKLSGAASGTLFGVDTVAANQRLVVVTATVTSGGNGISSRALVEVRNTTNPATIVVDSWRTG